MTRAAKPDAVARRQLTQMRPRLEKAENTYRVLLAERVKLLCAAHKAGLTYRDIGSLAGLSHEAVRQLVKFGGYDKWRGPRTK